VLKGNHKELQSGYLFEIQARYFLNTSQTFYHNLMLLGISIRVKWIIVYEVSQSVVSS